MLIDPSLCDVLSSYHRIPDCTIRLGIRRSTHDAIQSVLAEVVTLWQSINRSAAPDFRKSTEQMFICQLRFANPSSQLPSRLNSARGMSSQLVVYLLAKLAEAAIVGLSKDPPHGEQPSRPVLYLVISQATCLTGHTIAGCFSNRRQQISVSRANLLATKIPR